MPTEFYSVAFAPDGQSLATGSKDNTARLWDVATGRELRRFEGHGAVVISVAFAPDGRCLATASHDGTIRLWDIGSGHELARIFCMTNGEQLVLYGDGYSYWGSDGIDPFISLVRNMEAIPVPADYRARYFGKRTLDAVRQSLDLAVPETEQCP